MERKPTKILIIMFCIIAFASCGTYSNLKTSTYSYFKPRLDKKPYAAIKISRDMINGTPTEITVNKVRIPDSAICEHSTLYITMHKQKGLYILKYLKDYEYNYQTLDYDYVFETIDTVHYSVKNKLELSIDINDESYFYDIDLLKGRYIWLLYYWDRPDKLGINRRVGGFVDDVLFPL